MIASHHTRLETNDKLTSFSAFSLFIFQFQFNFHNISTEELKLPDWPWAAFVAQEVSHLLLVK